MSNLGIAQTSITGKSTAGGSGSSNSTLNVVQTAHGFSVGQAIYYTGTAWALAEANSTATLAIGIVSTVADANDFTVMFEGFINTLSGLTAGNYYFVSDSTPGLVTSVEPTNINSYSNPILFALSTSSGIVLPFRPSIVASGIAQSSTAAVVVNTLPASVNVTTEGTLDWMYWGNVTAYPDNLGASVFPANGTGGWKQMGGRSMKIWVEGLSNSNTGGGAFPTTTFSFNANDACFTAS